MLSRFAPPVFLAAFLTVACGHAVPVPSIDVASMARSADVIVVGRASRVSFVGGPAETFAISVDRVLKGTANGLPGAGSVRLDGSIPGSQSVVERQYGMFFLRRPAGSGPYVAVDPFHAILAASPAKSVAAASSNDALAAVTHELAQVFLTPAAALTNPTTGLQSQVDPAFQLEQIYLGAAEALRSVPYQTAGAEIRRMFESGQTASRMWALDCLLFMGTATDVEAQKVAYLGALAPVLLKPPSDLASTVSVVANALEGHLKTPNAVPALSALLRSNEVSVRRAAASVLSDIATNASITPLAKIALNDPDRDVRYYAVLGLAAATGSGEAPAFDSFQDNEPGLLDHWRQWAASNVP